MAVIPIILCGGVGQRLWPVSRAATPKPFMRVAGKSLLRRAVARASAMPGVSQCAVVTNVGYLHQLKDELMLVLPADHLIEREDEFAQAAVAADEVARTACQLVMPWQS